MATVAHTIYSHYDLQQRETLEHETGQIQNEQDAAWRTNTPQRRGAPQFVPATITYEEWGVTRSSQSMDDLETVHPRDDLAGWYRSLTSRTEQLVVPDSSSSDAVLPQTEVRRKREKRNRNNWFIMNALQSEPSYASSIPPTLADILARDPPPLPTEAKYSPPVWLTLGPSNKGFTMLQQSGWDEGEPLGPSVVRRRKVTHAILDTEKVLFKNKAQRRFTIKQEDMALQRGTSGEVTEVHPVDVIDLTLSDSDEPHESSPVPEAIITHSEATSEALPFPPPRDSEPVSVYSQKALLTPIPTVLKSDRLGIGLKAKTVGPYKASQKRITHNAAALAAHIRSAEEQRKKKAAVGRGRRGFEKMKRREEIGRKQMLAYLNE